MTKVDKEIKFITSEKDSILKELMLSRQQNEKLSQELQMAMGRIQNLEKKIFLLTSESKQSFENIGAADSKLLMVNII